MIYYVRHGQTEGNLRQIFIGNLNFPLNEVGIKQAEETAEKLKDIKFDHVFCSPTKRAEQTMKIILKNRTVSYVFDKRIIERSDGDLEGQKLNEIDQKRWNMDETYKKEWGESIEESFARVKEFFDEVLEKYPNKNILIVAHGGIGMLTRCYFYGFPKSGNLLEYRLKNAEIITFEN